MAAKKPEAPLSPEEVAAKQLEDVTMAEAMEDYAEYSKAQAASIWQYDEIPDGNLNLEEQLFVRSYVIDRNPVAAMRRLGHVLEDPAKLKSRSKKFLAKAEVADAIEYLAKRMMQKLDVTAEKVQRRIAAVAFFDPRQVMEFDKYGVRLMSSKYWTEEQAQAVKKIKNGQHGVEIEMYDGLKAAEMLAKQLGVQPEENDAAEAARIAADEAMERISSVFSRMLPGGKDVIDQHLEDRKQSKVIN